MEQKTDVVLGKDPLKFIETLKGLQGTARAQAINALPPTILKFSTNTPINKARVVTLPYHDKQLLSTPTRKNLEGLEGKYGITWKNILLEPLVSRHAFSIYVTGVTDKGVKVVYRMKQSEAPGSGQTMLYVDGRDAMKVTLLLAK